VSEYKTIVADYFLKKYGVAFYGSHSLYYKIGAKVSNGSDLNECLSHLETTICSLKKQPYYWINQGCTIDQALTCSQGGWSICKNCNTPYQKSIGFKTCCCEECYTIHRNSGFDKLSKSRLEYNPRDPNQYAIRHNISLEDAINCVDDLNNSCSLRTEGYWIKRGYTEEEAKQKVSEVQSGLAKRRFEKYSKEEVWEQSSFNPKFWMNKGFSEEESNNITKSIAKKGMSTYLQNTTDLERRSNNWMCVEYYQKKFPDSWEEEYDKRPTVFGGYTSVIAEEFCSALDSKFSWLESNRYFGLGNEFVSRASQRVYQYDYVDTYLKICVEFNGDYWHANPIKYEETQLISYPNKTLKTAKSVWEEDEKKLKHIEDRGFRTYVVWERDYVSDKESTVNNLYERIINENCGNN
jgi:G:T-mismatch repair DNA endonuclease (very short patch repair protein)